MRSLYQSLSKGPTCVRGVARWRTHCLADASGGEERGGAVAGGVVGPPLHLTGPQGQQRLGAIQGLNLTLFVHTEHQSLVGRVQVQSHYIPHLVQEVCWFSVKWSAAALR